MLTSACIVLAAVLVDWVLGEPRRLHPLVGFGRLADRLERSLYGSAGLNGIARKIRGATALLLLLLTFTSVAVVLSQLPYVGTLLSVLMLYLTIGHKSLHDHAAPIVIALNNADVDYARRLVSRMVSRDSSALDISAAATESVLENGNDGVFGALFWFAVAGAPGAVLYRLANTLDAMWGYRNQRYHDFGWAAARFDDVLNYFPARLTAITYALVVIDFRALATPVTASCVFVKSRQALACWQTQAPLWDSPNAGPVMAAGAGALGVTLGGPACYLGEWHQRPILGAGAAATADDIRRALQLVRHSVGVWVVVFFILAAWSHA
ncbi:MAG: cobalamin biosynthesis protein [Cycloclasticus sp.]|nr:cobalamin biosynthesis protein [Cycloclasticus sp.]